MEFVEGINLRQAFNACVASRRLPPARLVALLGREICQGLWFAHHVARDAGGARMRVVHRDLNPPNVLLSRTGQVKITDFGIARAMGEVRQDLTGKLEGKLGYMAPEQAREQPTDERCDLFAAGIILWELLCGERLFQGENEIETLLALVNREVPSVGSTGATRSSSAGTASLPAPSAATATAASPPHRPCSTSSPPSSERRGCPRPASSPTSWPGSPSPARRETSGREGEEHRARDGRPRQVGIPQSA